MKLFKRKKLPDYNLHNVVAVTIGDQRFDVVKTLGPAHLIIAAPREKMWPARVEVASWHGRVKGLRDGYSLYMVEAAHIVLHRAPVSHA